MSEIRFDWSITIGQVLQIALVLIGIASAWMSLKVDLGVIKAKVDLMWKAVMGPEGDTVAVRLAKLEGRVYHLEDHDA